MTYFVACLEAILAVVDEITTLCQRSSVALASLPALVHRLKTWRATMSGCSAGATTVGQERPRVPQLSRDKFYSPREEGLGVSDFWY